MKHSFYWILILIGMMILPATSGSDHLPYSKSGQVISDGKDKIQRDELELIKVNLRSEEVFSFQLKSKEKLGAYLIEEEDKTKIIDITNDVISEKSYLVYFSVTTQSGLSQHSFKPKDDFKGYLVLYSPNQQLQEKINFNLSTSIPTGDRNIFEYKLVLFMIVLSSAHVIFHILNVNRKRWNFFDD